jgi:hypothetical protein
MAQDGWFRILSDDSLVIGNFGEGSYPAAFPTHGHNDLTSFSWIFGSTPVLTDPGRFRYTADEVSWTQKSAAGHNLPLVNGFAPLSETLVPNGQWWPRPYAAALTTLQTENGGITMSHNGFARSTPVLRHTRHISPRGRRFDVTDAFEGQGEVIVDFCWHFGSGLDAYDSDAMAMSGAAGSVSLALTDSASGQPLVPLSCETRRLAQSPAYGALVPYTGLRVKLRLALPARVTTRFEVSICAA